MCRRRDSRSSHHFKLRDLARSLRAPLGFTGTAILSLFLFIRRRHYLCQHVSIIDFSYFHARICAAARASEQVNAYMPQGHAELRFTLSARTVTIYSHMESRARISICALGSLLGERHTNSCANGSPVCMSTYLTIFTVMRRARFVFNFTRVALAGDVYCRRENKARRRRAAAASVIALITRG